VSKYGSTSVVFEVDNASGVLTDMTQHTLELNGVEIEAIVEESHSFGDAWFESLATGLKKMADLVASGFYDDAAGGPNEVYGGVASSPTVSAANGYRTTKVTYGGTKTTTVEALIQKFGRKLSRGKIHMYEVTLRPSGAVVEA
jgi:hypothetical protein